ncbi:MAG: hypothetical protein KAS07_01335 [Candidatus Pacebacteria bacterium]|nr:hypothetical protein [Candidatus Paceibacterota bacterium]
MEEYDFEEFKSTGGRYNMTITLGKSERFYLGNTFCRKYKISLMRNVVLLYDKKKKAIGFKFLKEETSGSLDLKKLQDNSFYINAKTFLGIYDILPPEKYAGRYEPKEVVMEDNSKIFVIHLKESTEYKKETPEQKEEESQDNQDSL